MRDRFPSWTFWVGGFAFWTALALLNAFERVLWLLYRGESVDWGRSLAYSLTSWYACLVFIPLFVIATRRWPLDRRHLATRLPLHLGLTIVCSIGSMAILAWVRPFLPGAQPAPLASVVIGGAISEMIAFGCVSAALHAWEFYRRYRERERLALQLQSRLSDAQLRALRAQLNPHFLFNTLNAATALVHRDPDAADAMLTRLGELLRLTLRADPEHETPLLEEIALLERYLAIMRIRFADRVTVTSEVDEGVRDALVPSFILQPIVENAFEHGVSRVQRPSRIDISAYRLGASLVLRVCDDGPGPNGNGHATAASGNGNGAARSNGNDNGNGHGNGTGHGLGLGNTRRRLEELYGDAAALTMRAAPEGGTVVEVRLPLRHGAPA